MNEELKPCPLCNSPVTITGDDKDTLYVITCPHCHVTMSERDFYDKETLIKHWNTRCDNRRPALKACPICGFGAHVEHEHRLGYYIACDDEWDCRFKGPVRETEIEAARIWNSTKKGIQK